MCVTGNIITFRSTGGTTLNELTGNRIEFERSGGVYRQRADTRAKTKSETGGVKVLMGFEQDPAGAAEAQLTRPGNVLVLPSVADVEPHELTRSPFRNRCRHCVRAKVFFFSKKKKHTMCRVLAACRGSSQTTCTWVRMERRSPL